MRILAFCGCIGAGKDEAANSLRYRPNVKHVKFATRIRDFVALMAGIYESDLSHRTLFDNRIWKDSYALMTIGDTVYTPRKLLQMVGAGYRHTIHPDFWINQLELDLLKYPSSTLFVISDLRHKNEYEWVRQNDGIVCWITNPEAEKALENSDVVNHESEQYLDYLKLHRDAGVLNNGTLIDLASKIESIYHQTMDYYEKGTLW